MTAAPRPLLAALSREPHKLPAATRYALAVIWTWVTDADEREAVRCGRRVRVRVRQADVAEVTGEAPRSVARHVARLDEVGAAVRGDRRGELLLALEVADLRTERSQEHDRAVRAGGPSGHRNMTQRSERPRMKRTDESPRPVGHGDRRVISRGPTGHENMTDGSCVGSLSNSVLEVSRRLPRQRVVAQRPIDPAAEGAGDRPGLDARAILVELAQERLGDGMARNRPTRGGAAELQRLLAADGELAGEDGREVLRIARAYLRIVRERIPVQRHRGAAQPEDPRWWGPSMFKRERWSVVCGIVEQVTAAERSAARERERVEAEERRKAEEERRRAAEEAAVAPPIDDTLARFGVSMPEFKRDRGAT